jgi:hypothetical protein
LKISGQLKNVTNNPLQANVTVYNQGTNNANATVQTGGDGSYNLSILPGVYDIQYSIFNFFISNFWIKPLSINITSDLNDLINHITEYFSPNKISFTVNVSGNQIVQIYNSNKPKRVKINQTEIPYNKTLSLNPSWSYNETNKIITVKFSSQ